MKRVYGKQLAKSAIRMRTSSGELVFTERSTTGCLFTVAVHDGKIAKQNVNAFSLVF